VAPDDGGEIQLTDALKVQASEGRVLAYEFEGIRFDCGQVPGFVEATQYVFEHHYGQH
jgi:UTP--glucose-1-phosphate uridylyltransferase